MIALAAISLAGAALPHPTELPQTREQRVEGLERRLRGWRGGLRQELNGHVACETRRSTGDEALDAIACDALSRCAEPLNEGLPPTLNKLPQREVQAKLLVIRSKIQRCADRARRDQIQRLVDRRAATTTEM